MYISHKLLQLYLSKFFETFLSGTSSYGVKMDKNQIIQVQYNGSVQHNPNSDNSVTKNTKSIKLYSKDDTIGLHVHRYKNCTMAVAPPLLEEFPYLSTYLTHSNFGLTLFKNLYYKIGLQSSKFSHYTICKRIAN